MSDDDGLLAIEISSADESDTAASKVPRDYQSEAEFLKQKASWTPKVDNGELWKQLKLPIQDPSKPESQKILHAVEELYFLKKYQEASDLVKKALEGQLQPEYRKVLEEYHRRCQGKLKVQ